MWFVHIFFYLQTNISMKIGTEEQNKSEYEWIWDIKYTKYHSDNAVNVVPTGDIVCTEELYSYIFSRG